MGKIDVITLLPLLGVNNNQPLLHISKIFVYMDTTEEHSNKFVIGCMIKPTIHVNNVFRDQVEKFLRATFHQNTMEGIRNIIRKKDTCVIALVIFYNTRTKNPIKVYGVLSCVLYCVIENYVCIDYLCCHYKILSFIAFYKISE